MAPESFWGERGLLLREFLRVQPGGGGVASCSFPGPVLPSHPSFLYFTVPLLSYKKSAVATLWAKGGLSEKVSLCLRVNNMTVYNPSSLE